MMIGVIPAVNPIAHSEDAVDDEPRFAIDDFPLFLGLANEVEKAIVVAGHHGKNFLLTLDGKSVEFVVEEADPNLPFDVEIDLRFDGFL